MKKTDTPTAYGSITRSLHWGMAACYLFMFSTAIAWNVNDELMKTLVGPHKAVGIALLGLALLRFTCGGRPGACCRIFPAPCRRCSFRHRGCA